MKKKISVFLTILLVLSAIFSHACAGTPHTPNGQPDVQGGGAGSATAQQPRRPYQLNLNGTSAAITWIESDKNTLYVSVSYENISADPIAFSSVYYVYAWQKDAALEWDYQHPFGLHALLQTQTGKNDSFRLAYPLSNNTDPIEITMTSLYNPGKNGAVVLWFNPQTQGWGSTIEEANQPPKQKPAEDSGKAWLCPVCNEVRTTAFCDVCGTPRTEDAEPADDLPDPGQTAKAGRTEETIGSDPAPVPETFTHPLRAILQFNDGAHDEIKGETQEIEITESGQYTLTLKSPTKVHGVFFCRIQVKNAEGYEPDPTNVEGRAIRIDEVLLDGKPIKYDKTVTSFNCIKNYRTKEPENYYLAGYLYYGYYDGNDPVEEGDQYYYWDGDPAPKYLKVINTKDFNSFKTLTVTFSFGRFE